MSSPLTVEQLYLLAAERVDMLVDNAGVAEVSAFVNEGGLLYAVNVDLAALWDRLVLSNQDYCIKRHMIAIVANVEDYVLPDDYYKMRKVFPLDSSGNRGNAMRKFNLDELGREDVYNILPTAGLFETKYRVMGKRLFIYPVPTAATTFPTIEIWYYHDYPHVANVKDLIPHHYPAGWEDYVVEGIAARLKEKVDEDSTPYLRRQKNALSRIMEVVQDRDHAEPAQMLDDGREDYYY
jgi:hypothetical protein